MEELVYVKGNEAVCDSLQVAEKFGKRHDKLIHEIERMYGELIGKLDVQNGGTKMFQKSLYENRGKQYPMYLMNRDGFSLLVMGFTGKKALEWKLEYIKAFNKMESIIRERSTLEWSQARNNGKIVRRSETDAIQKLVEYAKAQGSKHSEMLYTTYSNLANKTVGIKDRNKATVEQLIDLAVVEKTIRRVVEEGIAAGIHYKQIFRDCKDRMEAMKNLAYIGELHRIA